MSTKTPRSCVLSIIRTVNRFPLAPAPRALHLRSAILALALASGPVLAEVTHHVSRQGSDTNSGTFDSPFLKIATALTVAQPGDTVLIAAGVYDESVVTVRGGTEAAPITIDGQGTATIKQFNFKHPRIHLQNLTITGVTNTYSRLVYFDHDAHHCILSNNVLDAAEVWKIYGIQWRLPLTGPFGSGEVASQVLIVSNLIRNIKAYPFVMVGGDSNVISGNFLRDGPQGDFFNVFGRNHLISGNVCSNMPYAEGLNNHPDFIQTWGNNGYASRGHIIEDNVVSDIGGGQLTQLEGNLLPDTRDWTFRNNIFMRVSAGGSGTIPDVKLYNNIFFQCSFGIGGHAISYGTRWYESFSVSPVSPYHHLIAAPIASGDIKNDATEPRDRRARYIVKNGWVIYNGKTNSAGQEFFGTNISTYIKQNDATEVWRTLPNYADGTALLNNVFLDCGDNSTEKGWYAMDLGLSNVVANYNYVGKNNYAAVNADSQRRTIGAAGGWSNFDWWEPNGINGGDPGFMRSADFNFRLKSISRLRAKGVALPGVSLDFDRLVRPQPPSIGPFDYTGDVPSSPSGLRLVPQ